jgi:sialate O-acetylesterase
MIKRLFICLVALIQGVVFANVRLPGLISDGMVLQRDTPVRMWGWADPFENIRITINDKVYSAITDAAGNWKLVLPPHKAGGPCDIKVQGKNSLIVKDVLFGDVWLCSGQSNMELPMRRVKPLYGEEMKTASNNRIRFFTVPQKYNFKQAQTDYNSGKWSQLNPVTVESFSAVCYFFATELYNKYRVPVGILNASLGGSPVQAWMSEEALRTFPLYLHEAYQFRNDELIQQITTSDQKRINAWYAESTLRDSGQQSPRWKLPDTDDTGWSLFNIPGYWNDRFPDIRNGVVWLRKHITIPNEYASQSAFLNLGRIVDADSVFVNGEFVGNITYQYPPRWYNVPQGILKEGDNVIAVRVVSNSGKGGFVPDKPYTLKVSNVTIDLKGEWKLKQGCGMPELQSETFIRWKPVGLYNAMIAPMIDYVKKGVVWYQGEANTDKPREYTQLLSTLIADWRNKFRQADLPFLLAQLPNFMEQKLQPEESNWALLREAQLKTLVVPRTGMSVNIDLGEWNDIHPLAKKPVGVRLARLAGELAYTGKINNASAPHYTSMKVYGNRVVLTFTGSSTRLTTNDGLAPGCFAIAGADRKFVWAQASISGNTIIVWSSVVDQPVAVRYAWADNPGRVNLYDNKGNPVSPFRTDNW